MIAGQTIYFSTIIVKQNRRTSSMTSSGEGSSLTNSFEPLVATGFESPTGLTVIAQRVGENYHNG